MYMDRIPLRIGLIAAFLAWPAISAVSVAAAAHEVRLALHDGKLHAPDLVAAVCRECHLPVCKMTGGNIDLNGLRGSVIVHAWNAALGNSCRLSMDRDAVILRVDPENLPTNLDDIQHALRVFTAEAAPLAMARQAAHWGLFMPAAFDSHRPLIVLIHGLDGEKDSLGSIAERLIAAGYQVGYFNYPQDQPIDDSSALFAVRMSRLVEQFPDIKINIIGHSMGGLIARDYVEGSAYRGEVDHLILIGAPNAGSSWAKFGVVLKAEKQFKEWKRDAEWSWTWPITAGLGEARDDLKPGSKFLTRLNSLRRRSGVRYTVIAGSAQPINRFSAAAVEDIAQWTPDRTRNWWGVRACDRALMAFGEKLRHKTGDGDGPVKIASAKLDGVDDVVILAADHCTLICPDHGNPPAAWETIRERLGH